MGTAPAFLRKMGIAYRPQVGKREGCPHISFHIPKSGKRGGCSHISLSHSKVGETWGLFPSYPWYVYAAVKGSSVPPLQGSLLVSNLSRGLRPWLFYGAPLGLRRATSEKTIVWGAPPADPYEDAKGGTSLVGSTPEVPPTFPHPKSLLWSDRHVD